MDDLRSRIVWGLRWSAAGAVSRQVLAFVARLVLARLLGPEALGTFAMLCVVLDLGRLLLDLGLGAAIVQRQDSDERQLSSVFWASAAAGAVLFAATALGAPAVAAFYGNGGLAAPLVLAAFALPLGALGVVPGALLARSLEFRKLSLAELGATALSSGAAVACALGGLGVWSLVVQAVVQSGLATLLGWAACAWRPRLVFDRRSLGELWGFARALVCHRFLDFFTTNLDNVLVGRFLGAAALGLYAKAYWLMLFPLRQVSEVVTRVMVPALSNLKEDRERAQSAYLAALGSIALAAFPALAALLAVADLFLATVFGTQWLGAAPILRVFCLVGMSHAVTTTTGWIYTSQGRTDLMLRWGIYAAAVKSAGIIVGLGWGAVGVAWGYTASTLVFLTAPNFALAGRLIGLRLRDVGRALGPGVLAAIAAGGAALVGRVLVSPELGVWSQLAAASACAAGAWAVAFVVSRKPRSDHS
jgi:PST family polysaccharide transporter